MKQKYIESGWDIESSLQGLQTLLPPIQNAAPLANTMPHYHYLHDEKEIRIYFIRLGIPSSGRRGLDLVICTQRVAARKLWLLCVFSSQFVSDTIKKLHIALLRVLLEGSHESPRHGTRGLGCDSGIGTVSRVSDFVFVCFFVSRYSLCVV